eukprot:CAMPEP_0174291512 /NCGR_PEP_ID=MMETSP0809-20121228/32302_1 /TAXON_ID=73025 ORGANISM="Eutreptiella gymnastica-like, Strain CCMP1594" /NCGR_SAMPLE_ID=MMETSP0809 /ASSEMBLY_ACC=CAM_ASM_000658 /LENGTH=65 /DNA_ID=CAMNT_0015390869 /DNA_START=45 /DNA_END=242 /DNA_ORIENTATION=+
MSHRRIVEDFTNKRNVRPRDKSKSKNEEAPDKPPASEGDADAAETPEAAQPEAGGAVAAAPVATE